jgi:hypothetical protein
MTTKKGMRGVALDGKTLRFTHENVGLFSQAGYEKLLNLDRINKGALVEADVLMASYLGNADILNLSLFYGLLADQPDVKSKDMEKDIKDISSMVDAWTEAGHSLLDLRRKIIEAFKLATDPSSVVSMLESWRNSDKQAEAESAIEKAIAEERIERTTKILKEAKTEKEKAKKTLTSPSPDLPASS